MRPFRQQKGDGVKLPFNVWRQKFLPQHTLSYLSGKLARCEIPLFKNWAIQRFIRLYQVELQEALNPDPLSYHSLHDFFTRQLKPECRPIDSNPLAICSPCDGTISQIGKINQHALIQAKSRRYTLTALLADPQKAQIFTNGHYVTIYLAPKDYHRVHMPCTGQLQSMDYLPGKLFSVNPLTAEHIENLFARNERVVTHFTHLNANFAIILVGAMIVGNIFTSWHGCVTSNNKMAHFDYSSNPPQLNKGEQMGYFSLGSTVILLFPSHISWEKNLKPNMSVKVGQRIGTLLPKM